MERKSVLENKYYLYLTEFFSGMSVMAVELGASRLLAPYFSSSQIVWTIIIGTIMIAMALGNIWGGKSADKDPNPDRLYRRLVIAAIWIGLIPLLGKYIIIGISALLVLTVNSGFLVVAAFVSCMVLFVYPLFLLGTVTPSLVKYKVKNLEENGTTVGALGAANTIGSILGTFLPTFVTIPAVGTSATFSIFAGILLILGVVYFVNRGIKRGLCAAAAGLILTGAVFGSLGGFAFWEKDLLYEGESIYNYLQVKDMGDSVILSTNVLFGVQSVKMKDDGLTGMYYDYALAAPFMAGVKEKGQLDVLVLGMGTGTYAKQCMYYFDNVSVEGVEIDEKITGLAETYFGMPESVPVATYDGRAYLQAVDRKYDVIMVDAYQDITIPFQMSSTEFFMLVQAHLKEDGVMVVNMNMKSDGEDGINAYLADTIAGVFGEVCTVDVKRATNRELFASMNPGVRERFEKNVKLCSRPDLQAMMGDVADGLCAYEGGNRILTDDKAPVELLGMRVIDEIIQDELGYYRQVFEEYGIRGILGEV